MTTIEGLAPGGLPPLQETFIRQDGSRAALVTRLLVKQSRGGISRTEGGVLSTLTNGPRRTTELAELEGLAQPTMTVLVRRLQRRGLVQRHGRADDGRVFTNAGSAALEDIRAQYRAVLRSRLVSWDWGTLVGKAGHRVCRGSDGRWGYAISLLEIDEASGRKQRWWTRLQYGVERGRRAGGSVPWP